ncbi:amidohydrolase family protein [Streptomyces sp. NPDC055134]
MGTSRLRHRFCWRTKRLRGRPRPLLCRTRAPFLLQRGGFKAAAALGEEFDTGLHTHSSETIWEVEESLRQFGGCPIEEFYNRGILGPRTVVAHCVWLDDWEIELLARSGTSVAHCPCSNMKPSSGPAR